jgi:REP element-mobilizing transposase RayT
MILATHAILSAYGFWLPNDPRGSWSQFVASWELLKFGPATTVTTHRSLAREPHDVNLRRAAKQALKRPPVRFTGAEALSIAGGFATATREANYVVLACCILPQHTHIVLRDHQRPVRQITGHLKARSTRQLREDGFYSDQAESPWAQRSWAVYLHSAGDVRRAIRYVEENPLKEGKRVQRWPFITSFEG